jgi:hypothetical protein
MTKTITTKFKSILTLFELINKVNQKDIQYLKQLYSQDAENFEDCINFLLLLDLIKLKSSLIELTPKLDQFLLKRPTENQVKEFVLNNLLNKRNLDVWDFLEKFTIIDHTYIFKPHLSENLHFSKIRNLLIELELISFNYDKKHYEITDKYIPYFIDIIKEHPLSPEKLKRIIEDQNKIGYLAELEIIQYEKSRLSSCKDLEFKIEHISLMDTSAGYDIKSYTVEGNSNVSERFIEVKAIPKLEKKLSKTRLFPRAGFTLFLTLNTNLPILFYH